MTNTPKDIRERTFEFALRIIKVCNELNRKPGVCRDISRQLLKAGTSVGANAEEAQVCSEQARLHQQEFNRSKRGSRNSLLVKAAYCGEDNA